MRNITEFVRNGRKMTELQNATAPIKLTILLKICSPPLPSKNSLPYYTTYDNPSSKIFFPLKSIPNLPYYPTYVNATDHQNQKQYPILYYLRQSFCSKIFFLLKPIPNLPYFPTYVTAPDQQNQK